MEPGDSRNFVSQIVLEIFDHGLILMLVAITVYLLHFIAEDLALMHDSSVCNYAF